MFRNDTFESKLNNPIRIVDDWCLVSYFLYVAIFDPFRVGAQQHNLMLQIFDPFRVGDGALLMGV